MGLNTPTVGREIKSLPDVDPLQKILLPEANSVGVTEVRGHQVRGRNTPWSYEMLTHAGSDLAPPVNRVFVTAET